MKTHEDTWKKNAEVNFWDPKMNAGTGWGNLDIQTRCTLDIEAR